MYVCMSGLFVSDLWNRTIVGITYFEPLIISELHPIFTIFWFEQTNLTNTLNNRDFQTVLKKKTM